MIIQKMFEIHDYLYTNKDLIPKEAFDGKDKLKTVYVLTHEPFHEDWAYNYYLSQDLNIVEEELEEVNKCC